MKIALLQQSTGSDKSENLALFEPLIRDAARSGATLIVLPEAASQGFEQGRLDTQAEEFDGEFSMGLKKLADELGITIVAGIFRPADTNVIEDDEKGKKKVNRVYNTALITGDGVHKGYDKIHTYDAFNFKESDTVKPGEELVTFVHEGVLVGVAICFDIRFPEQFKELSRRGAELIVVPTSWADGPGKLDQWRLLARSRALDTGAFIAAAGQARPDWEDKAGEKSGPTGIGHSVVVAPDGVVVQEAGYGPETILVEIDPDAVTETRRAIPLAAMSFNARMR